MKIKITKKARWIKLLMGLNILFWYHLFYLFHLPDRISLYLRKDHLTFVNVILYILILIYLYRYHKHLFKEYDKNLQKYFVWLFAAYFIQVGYTIIRYPLQSSFNTIITGAPFLQLIAIPIYLYIFEADHGEEKLLNFIDIVVFLWCVILIAQSLYYNATGGFLFDFLTYFQGDVSTPLYVATRVYGIRVGVGCFGNFIVLYNFSKLYNKEIGGSARIFALIRMIVDLYAIVVIQQTRMWTIIVLVCIAFLILSGNKSKRTRTLEFIGVVFAAIILFGTGIVSNFLTQFNAMTVASQGISSSNRLYAINYYLNTFTQRPILGNGLTSPGSKEYSQVEHGGLGYAYYVDVGIFGLLAQTGLCSIIFFFWPFIFSIRTVASMKDKRRILGRKYNLDIAILIYIALSSFTLLITNNGLEPLFPIIIAIFLYHKRSL